MAAVLSLCGCGQNSVYDTVDAMIDAYLIQYGDSAKPDSADGTAYPWSKYVGESGSGDDNEANGSDSADTDSSGDSDENPEEDAAEENFLMDEAGHFAYDRLNNLQQLWYKDIEKALGGMKTDVKLSAAGLQGGLDEKDIDIIFQCVMIDHPEIFYVDGYSYNKYFLSDKTVSIRFSGTYNCDLDTAKEKSEKIKEAAQKILLSAPSKEDGTTSDYDIIKYVYDTLIQDTDYNLNAPDNQNIYSVFAGHESVCLGYAKATQYLLLKLGIECTLVQGSVEGGESHAWNLVNSDGDYYYVDTTWGDASYRSNDESGDVNYSTSINYDYLCVTTAQLTRTHTIESYVELPVCTADKDNYYVRENALFYQYDEEKIRNLFEKAMEEGRQDVTLKCADGTCFQDMKERLIDNQEIFSCLPVEVTQITYANNSKQLSLTFWIL
jgi:hypothetical protein